MEGATKGQRTTCRSCFSPSTMWVLRTGLRSPRFGSKCLYRLGHLAGPEQTQLQPTPQRKQSKISSETPVSSPGRPSPLLTAPRCRFCGSLADPLHVVCGMPTERVSGSETIWPLVSFPQPTAATFHQQKASGGLRKLGLPHTHLSGDTPSLPGLH